MQLCDTDSQGNIYVSPYGSTTNRGLWRSANGGSTWTRVIDGDAWGQWCGIWGFDEAANGTLYASNYGTNESHVYKSTNNGVTWASVLDASAIDTHIHRLSVDKTSGVIYISLGDTTRLHYYSNDAGANWNTLFDGMSKSAGQFSGYGYTLFASDDTSCNISKTSNTSTFDVVFNPYTVRGFHFYGIGGDENTGNLMAVGVCNQSVANYPSAAFFSSDHGASWHCVLAMAVGTTQYGYDDVSRKAVNGKVIVSFTGKDLARKNSYLVDLSTMASEFTLSPPSPCINAGANTAWATVASVTDLANYPITNAAGAITAFMGTVDIGAYEWVGDGGGLSTGLGMSGGHHPPAWRRRR